MITVFVSSDSTLRGKEKEKLLKQHPDALVVDDTSASFETLRAFAYPSLFDKDAPVVIASFMGEGEMSKELVQDLAASPTQFFLFERTLATDTKKLFSKYGSVEVLDTKVVKKVQPSLFYDASALVTESNKLKRWQKLQTLLQTEVPEAFIGIVYWKLRDMTTKGNIQSKAMYDALINAHAEAWINGTTLANAIEKVLLTQ